MTVFRFPAVILIVLIHIPPAMANKICRQSLAVTQELRPMSMRHLDNVVIYRREGVKEQNVVQYNISKAGPTYKTWTILETEVEGTPYQFVRISIDQLRRIHESFTSKIRVHVDRDDDKTVVVRLKGEVGETENIWLKFRWAFHKKVLSVYQSVKADYLSVVDMQWLEAINHFGNNHDSYGVLSAPHNTDLSQMTEKQVMELLQSTIQVTYQETYRYDIPNPHELFPNLFKDGPDWLPFQYRVDPKKRKTFFKKFNADFKNKKLAEITRYAKFNNIFSGLQSKMILEALINGEKKGVQTFVITVDPVTRRLFSRLGFKIYQRVPTEQQTTPEFLMFLHVDSVEYRSLIEKLRLDVEKIYFRTLPFTGYD